MLLSILTTRERPQYFAATMASLMNEGGNEHQLYVHVDRTGSSCQAMRAIFATAWLIGGREDLLYFEDDVLACPDAVRAMSRVKVPEGMGFLSFCSITRAHPAGVSVATGALLGAQALRVAARTLRDIRWPEGEWNGFGSDVMLSRAVGKWGRVGPSLFKHVGENSGIAYQDGFGAARRQWITPDWYGQSALSLPFVVDRGMEA